MYLVSSWLESKYTAIPNFWWKLQFIYLSMVHWKLYTFYSGIIMGGGFGGIGYLSSSNSNIFYTCNIFFLSLRAMHIIFIQLQSSDNLQPSIFHGRMSCHFRSHKCHKFTSVWVPTTKLFPIYSPGFKR